MVRESEVEKTNYVSVEGELSKHFPPLFQHFPGKKIEKSIHQKKLKKASIKIEKARADN
jgi:hypothetical protein